MSRFHGSLCKNLTRPAKMS